MEPDPNDDMRVPPEVIPDLERFVIETPHSVRTVFTQRQQRLLIEPLYSSWAGPEGGNPWVALANVGVFYSIKHPPLAPDVLLSFDVEQGSDFTDREHLAYFVWLRGKLPDIVIEIVTDRSDGEDTEKLARYEDVRIPYYVIFDPLNTLGGGILRGFQLMGMGYAPVGLDWLPYRGLGLRLWEGEYEGTRSLWLRWVDREGRPIPTGKEQAEQRPHEVERLKARLREIGDRLPD